MFFNPLDIRWPLGFVTISSSTCLPKVHDDGAVPVPRFKPVELSTKKGLRGRQTSDDKKGGGETNIDVRNRSALRVPLYSTWCGILFGSNFLLKAKSFLQPQITRKVAEENAKKIDPTEQLPRPSPTKMLLDFFNGVKKKIPKAMSMAWQPGERSYQGILGNSWLYEVPLQCSYQAGVNSALAVKGWMFF